MHAFTPNSITLTGRLTVDAPIDDAFPLFSPVGERGWVPGWNPELLFPAGAAWERGQIFRTQEESGEAVWIISELDRAAHSVEYHRVESGRYVARVRVHCESKVSASTDVTVAYTFIGLSEAGNREIAAMTQGAYAEKMNRWAAWIGSHLATRSRQ